MSHMLSQLCDVTQTIVCYMCMHSSVGECAYFFSVAASKLEAVDVGLISLYFESDMRLNSCSGPFRLVR